MWEEGGKQWWHLGKCGIPNGHFSVNNAQT